MWKLHEIQISVSIIKILLEADNLIFFIVYGFLPTTAGLSSCYRDQMTSEA